MTTKPFETLAITGVGACTCAGLNAQQCSASVRAGINRFVEHPDYLSMSKAGADPDEPVPPAVAMVPTMGPELNSTDRLMHLLITAFRDLLDSRQLERTLVEKAGFFLALPPDDPGCLGLDLGDSFLDQFAQRTALNPFPVRKIIRVGNTGMTELIHQAAGFLIDGQLERCIVAGVDSYFIGSRLEMLDKARRLKSPANIGGFIPGEGATAVMLETVQAAQAQGVEMPVKISGVGLQREPNGIRSEKASSGEGLANAIRDAVDTRAEGFTCDWVIGDLNGEAYQSFEWGTVLVRLRSLFPNLNGIWHPVDCVGDIGTATPGLHLVQAVSAFQRGYAPCGDALVWSSSDTGQRAAMLLSGELK